MLSHAFLYSYLLTRLDPITALLHNIIFWSVIVFIVMVVFCLFSEKEWEQDIHFMKTNGKRVLYVMVPVAILSVLVPNRQEGLIILGATAGAEVIQQSGATLDKMTESERFGKVMELVDTKIDKMIQDAKQEEAKEEKK